MINAQAEETATVKKNLAEAKYKVSGLKKTLKDKQKKRNITPDSAAYLLDEVLKKHGIDRQAYHGKLLVGEHVRKLLENAKEIVDDFRETILEVRETSIAAEISGIADESDIHSKCSWFLYLLALYNVIFYLLRRIDCNINDDELSDLQVALDWVAKLWATTRCGEKQAANFTHKLHCLLVHVLKQLKYLGCFGPFLEDPIERMHKDDKNQDRLFSCIRAYFVKEEAKGKRAAISRNPLVQGALQRCIAAGKRKFTHLVEKDTMDKRRRLVDEAAAAYEEVMHD